MNFKFYLNEVDEFSLGNIDLNRQLFFDNLFKNKLRLVIPLNEGSEEIKKFIQSLEQEGVTVEFDDLVNKKVIYRKVNTRQGFKLRPEKAGAYLQKKIEKATTAASKKFFEQLLDWWQKNSNKLKGENDNGASIIISRSPIDLVRMSDHDNITSCHSPNRSFFKCAKQEARTGGAVAYVVKNSDIKDVDIQKPELFKDKQRNVEGIVPLERLRLRRLTNGEIDLLIPELRTYGIKNVGFTNAVKNWAKKAQQETIEKIDPEKSYDSFKLKGGSYFDAGYESDVLWNSFFDSSISGELPKEDEDQEEGDGDEIYDVAERQIREHSANWNHFSVHHDVYEENTLDYSAYFSFSLPKKLFTVSLSWKSFDSNEDEKAMYQNWQEVKKIISKNIDIYSINDMEIDTKHKDVYVFNVSLYDESHLDRGDNQLTRLEQFLDYIDDVDKNFDDHISKVYKALAEDGYIKTASEQLTFKNFTIEEDDDGDAIKSKTEKIGYLKEFPVFEEGFGGFSQEKSLYESEGKLYLNKLRNKFVTTNDFNKLKLLPFIERAQEVKLYVHKSMSTIKKTDERVSIGKNTYNILRVTGWVYFEFEKNLGFDMTSKTKHIQLLKNIDKNWDFYLKRIAKFFDSFIKLETKGYGWTRKEAPDFPFNDRKEFSPFKPTTKKPEYSQKTLNFKEEVLSEMPIKGFNLIGQWGPNAKRKYGYNKQDTGILENPKAVEKIHKSWYNTKYDFDFYFIRSYKASKHIEVGQVSLDWVKENLEIELKVKEDHITIIFTNNRGDEKIPMTAWAIAHRLGHAIRKENIFEDYFRKRIDQDFNEILKYVYGLDPWKRSNYQNSIFVPYYNENKYKKSLFSAVGKMKSARENKLRTSSEFIYELVAQYIVTGKIRFNDLPRQLILDRRMAWGRPNYKVKNTIDEEAYKEYNAQLHNNAATYEHYLDSVFGSLVNKIFVM
jgi:hypothetical protein